MDTRTRDVVISTVPIPVVISAGAVLGFTPTVMWVAAVITGVIVVYLAD